MARTAQALCNALQLTRTAWDHDALGRIAFWPVVERDDYLRSVERRRLRPIHGNLIERERKTRRAERPEPRRRMGRGIRSVYHEPVHQRFRRRMPDLLHNVHLEPVPGCRHA